MKFLQQRRLSVLALVSAWLLLAGCGPQGGGTGTGETVFPLSDFGARAAGSCSSAIAGTLDCGDLQPGTADVTTAGTADLNFIGAEGRDRAWLHLWGNRAALELHCGGARFEGEWGVLADGTQAYFGAWSSEGPGRAVRAMLTLRPLPGDAFELAVTDTASRQLLIAGLTVRRGSPPVPGC